MNKSIIKKILGYLKNYNVSIAFSMFCALVSVVGTLSIPVIIGQTIDYIIAKDNVDFITIANKLVAVLVIALVIGLSQWIMNSLNNKITFSVVRDLRDKAFKKIQILPMSYIDSHKKGEIVSRIINDVDTFADGLLMGFTQLFTGVITIVGTLIFMFSINVWITLVVVCVTPLSFLIANFIAKKTFKMFGAQSKARGEQTAFIDEMVGNLKVVNAYNHQNDNISKFDVLNDKLKNYSLKATFYSSITNPATRFVNSIVYTCVALFGAILCVKTQEQAISIGVLICFLSYANQYTKPFNEITGVIAEIQNAFACAQRVFEIIEETPEKEDKSNAISLSDCKGQVQLKNVEFSYDKDKKLLEDINIYVKPGQKVAIVGPTGCGKTTLINLLMKFYNIDKGKITIDDEDYDNLKTHSIRQNYGMVLQDTWIKAGTIRENILIGNKNATDEEIIKAAKKAHSHSFISKLPNGYDTYIGENGGSLSQGQKQLICITRLMLCNPSILILDEATSSIDTRTEIKIQKAFNNLMKGKTAFIVAHRLATVKDADIILVMNEGKIVESGTHSELLSKNGLYKSIYNSQFIK